MTPTLTVSADTGKTPFAWPVRVYWEDTDAGGIVYYANYLKFFERARTEWLRAKGIHQQALLEETGGMFVVSEAQVRYLKSARLDDELLLTTSLTEAGRASLTIRHCLMINNLGSLPSWSIRSTISIYIRITTASTGRRWLRNTAQKLKGDWKPRPFIPK